jgi:hypothetical protein
MCERLVYPIEVIILFNRLASLVIVQVQVFLDLSDEFHVVVGRRGLVLCKVHFDVIHQGLNVLV